jgi:hypothetical protein
MVAFECPLILTSLACSHGARTVTRANSPRVDMTEEPGHFPINNLRVTWLRRIVGLWQILVRGYPAFNKLLVQALVAREFELIAKVAELAYEFNSLGSSFHCGRRCLIAELSHDVNPIEVRS